MILLQAAEKDDEQSSSRRIHSLTSRLSTMSDKCHALNLDLALTRTNYDHLRHEHEKLERAHESALRQLELVTASKDELSTLLADRASEASRACREREESIRSSAAAQAEMVAARFVNDKLTVQLEERERNFLALKVFNMVFEAISRYLIFSRSLSSLFFSRSCLRCFQLFNLFASSLLHLIRYHCLHCQS